MNWFFCIVELAPVPFILLKTLVGLLQCIGKAFLGNNLEAFWMGKKDYQNRGILWYAHQRTKLLSIMLNHKYIPWDGFILVQVSLLRWWPGFPMGNSHGQHAFFPFLSFILFCSSKAGARNFCPSEPLLCCGKWSYSWKMAFICLIYYYTYNQSLRCCCWTVLSVNLS